MLMFTTPSQGTVKSVDLITQEAETAVYFFSFVHSKKGNTSSKLQRPILQDKGLQVRSHFKVSYKPPAQSDC